MDQRDGIPPLASDSYYIQQGNAGMGLQGSSGMSSLSNPGMQFQSTSQRNLLGSSSSVDASSSMAPHGIGSPPALGVGSPPALGAGPPPGMMQGEPVKRKRGRPRKYGSGMTLTPSASAPERPTQRKKGRPPGTGKKQQQTPLGESIFTGHAKFNPYILNVNVGEDIKGKVLAFAQGQQNTVVISATGTVSTVNIRVFRSEGIVPVTYEGYFNILSFTGSFTQNDVNAPHAPVGSLNVTLSGADGLVLGGGVEAFIYAGSPVQVVVASLSPRIPKARTSAEGTPGGSQDRSGGNLGTPATV